MSILASGPLMFSEPNCPTRVGEMVETVNDLYNISSPREGMQVFVKAEKKTYVITSLKEKVVNGVSIPNAAVDKFELMGDVDVVWSAESNMNDYTESGVYNITGERTVSTDNLPIANTGGGHTFDAKLFVLDSSIPGDGKNTDKCVTQILTFSNRVGGDGNVYIRTGRGASEDNLTWEAWSALLKNKNVGAVTTLDDLIDNGVYSGVFVGDYSKPHETFILVVINDYQVAITDRHVSQFYYSVDSYTGETTYNTRTGSGTPIKWSDWHYVNYLKIQKDIEDLVLGHINTSISELIGTAPETLDTIHEIASWIVNDKTGAAAMAQQIESLGGLVDSAFELINEETNKRTEAINDVKRKAIGVERFGVSNHENDVDIHFAAVDSNAMTSVTIPAATTEKAGVMSAEDKSNLNSLGTNEYDALSADRRTDGFAYHVSGISLGSTYEGQTIGKDTCSICEKITLTKGQKLSYRAYADNRNAIIITDANNKVIYLSGAYTVADGEYTATDTCYVYCTAVTSQITSNSYHCTVSASGMKATVERLESDVNVLQSKTDSFMQGYRELFVNGTLNVEMEQGSWIGFGEVGDNYTEKTDSSSTVRHYKVQVNQGTKLKYLLYAEGKYNVVVTDLNGTILHKVGNSSNWQNHTGEYIATEECVIYINQSASHATIEHSDFYAILVDKDIRPRIDIKASDSEIEIWHKLKKAFRAGGYDVYFEHATYTFKEIYDIWNEINHPHPEMPIGGGCNYYCNGATFISVDPDSGHVGSRATFGVVRSVQSFYLQDANIINIGGTYCFHDEGQNKEGYYLHKYINCKMKYIANEHTTYLGKPLGGGMGLRGDVVIDNCYFENTNTIVTDGRRAYPVSWHGNLLTDSPCTFNLSIFNSVFVGGFVALGGNEKNQGDTNTLYLSNNNADTEPYISETGNWTTYIWNNDTNAPNLALRALFVAAGAEYNDTDVNKAMTAPWGETVQHLPKHYYLNGLGDITEEQMMAIYLNKDIVKMLDIGRIVQGNTILRTMLPIKSMLVADVISKRAFYGLFSFAQSAIEVFRVSMSVPLDTSSLEHTIPCSTLYGTFYNCTKLSLVYPINVKNVTDIPKSTFSGCTALKELRLYGLKVNLDISDSMNVSKKSVLYLIQNATPSSAITITLHADAYARLAEDADIVAALETQPLITLVSA